jgi:hypothetical protein
MRFVLPGNPQGHIRKVLSAENTCLALYAAADALGYGFVHRVPPYVYTNRLDATQLTQWDNLRPCHPGETTDIIIRQAPAPQSVFRGVIQAKGLPASDILQVWVDVASHPSRGREQAALIRRHVLDRIIKGSR